jgi:hypothetical protein
MSQTMAIEAEPAPANQKPCEWPFITEFFMVQSDGLRCMAYRDANGKWRQAFSHEELSEDIQVLE